MSESIDITISQSNQENEDNNAANEFLFFFNFLISIELIWRVFHGLMNFESDWKKKTILFNFWWVFLIIHFFNTFLIYFYLLNETKMLEYFLSISVNSSQPSWFGERFKIDLCLND